MRLSKQHILIIVLLGWLSALIRARALPSTNQECSESHCPFEYQNSTSANQSKLNRLSNNASKLSTTNSPNVFASAVKRETIVELENTKYPQYPKKNSPNTKPENLESRSDDDDGGSGLDLDKPADTTTTASAQDPGSGLDLDKTTPTPQPTATASAASSVSADTTTAAASPSSVASNASIASDRLEGSLITIDEAKAKFCPSSGTDLRLRSLCQPQDNGSDDAARPSADDGEDSEEGQAGASHVPDTSAGEQPVAPPPRDEVTNWYDVIGANPKPQFRAREALDDRISGQGQDRDAIPDNVFDSGYELTDEIDEDVLRGIGLSCIKTMWETLQRSSPGPAARVQVSPANFVPKDANDLTPIIQDTTFAGDGSFIGALESFRVKDPLRGGPNEIVWSERVFHIYSAIMANVVNGLNSVAQCSIANTATELTIESALTKTGQTTNSPSEIVTFRRNADGEEALAFEAISRSDNVNGVLWLLADHFTSMGRKDITAIHVARQEKGSGTFHMIIDVA